MTPCNTPIVRLISRVDSFKTAVKTIYGIETMHRIKKGQVEEIQSALSEVKLFNP